MRVQRVDLQHRALLAPQAVDLPTLDHLVGLRERKAGVADQLEHAALQARTREAVRGVDDAPPAGPRQLEVGPVDQSRPLGRLERPPQLGGGGDIGVVDERAGG